MPHAKVDVALRDHPRAVACGPAAMGLWLAALLYIRDHLTDGVLPSEAVPGLFGGGKSNEKLAKKLVEEGLFSVVPGGYRLARYEEKNQTKVQVIAAIEAARRRMQKARCSHDVRANIERTNAFVPTSTSTSTSISISGLDPEGGAGGPPADPPPPASSTHPTPPPPANDLAPPPDPEERYRRAYVAGIEAGTGRGYAFPSGLRDQGALNASLPAHGRDLDGTPHTGPKLLAWITHKAGEYARWVGRLEDDERKFWPLAPSGWARWLNDGRDRPAKPPRPTAPYHAPAKRAWAEPAPEERITAAQVAELSAVVGRGGAR